MKKLICIAIMLIITMSLYSFPITQGDGQDPSEVIGDYVILIDRTFLELQDRVNLFMQEGWTPQGGLSVYYNRMAQAMVRVNK